MRIWTALSAISAYGHSCKTGGSVRRAPSQDRKKALMQIRQKTTILGPASSALSSTTVLFATTIRFKWPRVTTHLSASTCHYQCELVGPQALAHRSSLASQAIIPTTLQANALSVSKASCVISPQTDLYPVMRAWKPQQQAVTLVCPALSTKFSTQTPHSNSARL